MSKYAEIQTELRDRQALVAALRELGYQPEVHDEPVHLYDWHGHLREELAHIVIPRAQIDSYANDVGFIREADGRYRAIISEYDARAKWTPIAQGRLKQLYAVHKQLATAQRKGYRLLRRETTVAEIRLVFQGR